MLPRPDINPENQTSTMVHRAVAILCLSLLLLPLLPPESRAARPAAGVETHRVYYVFATQQPVQRLRAEAAHRALRPLEAVAWVAVASDAGTEDASLEALAVDQVLSTPGLPRPVRSWLRGASPLTDAVLVENLDDGRIAAGAGADLARIARATGLAPAALEPAVLPPESVATDVGFTTWGKVKDLFR